MPRTRLVISITSGFFLFFLDQTLKVFARAHPTFAWYLWQPWLGWEYFANPGVAFGLPIPNALLIIITPLILLYLLHLLFTKPQSWSMKWGITLIVTGALSNFIDRVVFGVTIDYIRILTSVLNLGDLMIVVGAMLLLYPRYSKTKVEVPKI